MSATAILESAVTGKSGDLITIFQKTMYEKIFEALDIRRQELAKTIFNEDALDENVVSIKPKSDTFIKLHNTIKSKNRLNNTYNNRKSLYNKLDPEEQDEWNRFEDSVISSNRIIRKPKSPVYQPEVKKPEPSYNKPPPQYADKPKPVLPVANKPKPLNPDPTKPVPNKPI